MSRTKGHRGCARTRCGVCSGVRKTRARLIAERRTRSERDRPTTFDLSEMRGDIELAAIAKGLPT